MKPYFETENGKLYHGDCLEILNSLPESLIQCCVTSPPYWGLRDYGTDNQLGLEKSPEIYVQKMVEVFRLVRELLKDDGVLWLNLGDSYAGSTGQTGGKGLNTYQKEAKATDKMMRNSKIEGLKPKDLVGIPWMVAFALRADGWWLRQDIIWAKPNPMPESVQDRCTKAHEYIFLLSKSGKYYYNAESIMEDALYDGRKDTKMKGSIKYNTSVVPGQAAHSFAVRGHERWPSTKNGKPVKNKRSVWTVPTKPYSGAHFATFPPALIEPCILAGCPKGGVILDPFMGAGTTAIVAEKLNRKWIGIELSLDYCRIAKERIERELQQKKIQGF